VEKCGVSVDVIRDGELELDVVDTYDKIIFSPGPGLPRETKTMFEIIRCFGGQKPILGVCLGMQGIAEFFGGKLINQPQVMHGKQVEVNVLNQQDILFKNLPAQFPVGLYHSWCVDEESIPACLAVTSKSEKGVIMSLRHKTKQIFGVQFHPESIMTPDGLQLIENFLSFT